MVSTLHADGCVALDSQRTALDSGLRQIPGHSGHSVLRYDSTLSSSGNELTQGDKAFSQLSRCSREIHSRPRKSGGSWSKFSLGEYSDTQARGTAWRLMREAQIKLPWLCESATVIHPNLRGCISDERID